MRRSLALLQESYCESESEEEKNTGSSIDNLKDKPQSKVVSYAIKCIDVDEVIHSKNSKSSDHQDDTSDSRMNIIECFDMNISLDDIPLPPDAFPKDMLQPELASYSKLSINSNEKNSIKSSIINSKSSDHGKDPSDSQMLISGVSPLSIDDTLEDKLQFELMPFVKEDVNDENSSSEDLKTPLHEDDSSVSRGTISEESPMSSDDTSKVRLPYELESMCYEGMDDDETTGSEDSKSYDNQDGSSL